jgi:malonyl-CoA O-methyltransferase
MSAPIDPARVRCLFADPARVAAADFLRREIASRMFERLALVKTSPRQVLDAGCGTGADHPAHGKLPARGRQSGRGAGQ